MRVFFRKILAIIFTLTVGATMGFPLGCVIANHQEKSYTKQQRDPFDAMPIKHEPGAYKSHPIY